MTDQAAFRRALGTFATGVTVVTARAPGGGDVGVTASSFNSVSLDPPLVLWSLNNSSSSLGAFLEGGRFAVHILAADQQELANRFAGRSGDRFAGLDVDRGDGDVPLLRHYAACFECRLAYCYEGGDHRILVGEVVRFHARDGKPLVYHGGRFGHVHTPSPAVDEQGPGALLRVISRVYHRLNADTQRELQSSGLTQAAYWVLRILGARGDCGFEMLAEQVARGGRQLETAELDKLTAQGFVARTAEGYGLTDAGRAAMVRLAAIHAASEQAALETLDRSEKSLLAQLLARLVTTDSPAS
jgi:3-hydroxy-9,10-secoandrosta-1,3,5(10)-triene-9,17-dione monooxygenase reductase component